MPSKLLSIAAVIALALAGAAHAADNPKVDRKAMKAEKDKVEATYKADKAKCKDMKGNSKDVCEADAKGKHDVAKAELDQKYAPTPAHQRKVDEAKADRQYSVAKEKCDGQKGQQKSACEKQAKASHDRARADIKQRYAKSDNVFSRTGANAPGATAAGSSTGK